MRQRMHLVHMLFHAPITHTALSWANEADGHLAGMDSFAYWQKLARTLERGGFDALFFADTAAVSDQLGGGRDTPLRHGIVWPTHDPMPLVAVMAAATERLGFGVTLSVAGTPPYLAHRRISTLDYLSGGRIAWNVVTSHMQAEHRALGAPMREHDERYDHADEYMEVCYALWDSVPREAILKDAARGILADPALIRPVSYKGRHVSCEAVSPTLPSPQGRPVIFQAGSSGRGIQFAARHADVVFAIQPDAKAMRDFDARLGQAAEAAGRAAAVKTLFGLQFVIGGTEAEARRHLEELRARIPLEAGLSRLSGSLGIDAGKVDPDLPLDDVPTQASRGMMDMLFKAREDGRRPTVREAAIQMGLTGGLPQIVGSPEQIADRMEALWRESGAFGFNLSAATLPGSVELFVEHVVPILRKRGIVRAGYEGKTLRDHLN